jgi:transcriptional regulator with XRE-family HTH domain
VDPALVRALERAERALGARLRELRQEAGFSQEAAAERAYLSSKHLRRLELGQANATMASLVACARAYGVTLADLFAERRKSR